MLNDLLLELTTYTTRLRVLLTEAEEDEFRAALPRFKGFIEEVERLPAEPQRRRRIGFQAPPPKPVKATKKTKKGASKKKR